MRLIALVTGTSCVASILAARAVDLWLTGRIAIAGSFIGLQRAENEGIAFGLHLGPYQDAIILLAVLAVMAVALRSAIQPLERIGFGLILGGGVANIIDRLPDGTVTDMIQIGSFPVFNVADICINVGVAFLLAEMILGWRKPQKPGETARGKP
ncbi:MAG: signal peptidase II [Candidatus Peribacteraceae bacterium]|nr:signal peptidase II [Candidatus Peribacteraceae bacterium]